MNLTARKTTILNRVITVKFKKNLVYVDTPANIQNNYMKILGVGIKITVLRNLDQECKHLF